MNDRPSRPTQRYGFAAFREPSYAFYWASRILATLAIEMQSTAVGWHVYRLTDSELALGLIGLVQFAPFALLFLVTGLVADRFSRVRILAICVATQTICAALFFAMTWEGDVDLARMLIVLGVFGVARAFMAPVQQSIVPNIVPQHLVANAIAWNSTGLQIARIVGPTIAGIVIAFGAESAASSANAAGGAGSEVVVYCAAGVLLIATLLLTAMIRLRSQALSREPVTVRTLVAGLRFLWTRQLLFAAVALDLFAVLFGGTVALLPIFARDILMVGPEGFGMLRSALTVGAITGAVVLTQRSITQGAGFKLLASAAIFGIGVIVFGLSTSFWLSLAALYVMGASDVVSVFIRHNLVQLIVPDEMRGRVGAVVGVMVGASNELGEFKSGVTAHWWGTIPAVIAGGAATVAVVAAFAWAYPVIRRLDSLDPEALISRFRTAHGRRM